MGGCSGYEAVCGFAFQAKMSVQTHSEIPRQLRVSIIQVKPIVEHLLHLASPSHSHSASGPGFDPTK